MPEDYEYEVFFSYKRHGLTLNWTREVHARITLWLSEELGGSEARVFVDESSIDLGAKWPEAIKYALRHSRCMVCVWSPSYFQSAWCVSEWKSFLKREEMLKMERYGLIAPLRFHDGEHFPADAKDVQWEDVAPYTATVPAFWNSPKAVELDDKLKLFAAKVAKIIQKAPPFQTDWPVVEAKGMPAPKIGLEKL
jgi:TIR domain